jgi:ATP-dependent helicase/nuclease subunit A
MMSGPVMAMARTTMSELAERWLSEDARARREACNVTRSVILQAPAGSGKTTVLVCRMLELLATVDVPESILAITFTRKAAAEMRHRVLRALRDAAAGRELQRQEAPAAARALAHAQRLGWDLLNTPTRLRVQTIDATHQRLAALCPVTSGSSGALRVATQPTWLYQSAARRCVQTALADQSLGVDCEFWLQRLDNNWERLTDMIAGMLARRSFWLPLIVRQNETALLQRVEDSVQRIIAHSLAQIVGVAPAALLAEGAAIADLAARAMVAGTAADGVVASDWLGGAAASQSAAVTLRALPIDLPRWRFLRWFLLTDEDAWRKQLTVRQGVGPKDKVFKQRAQQWLADMSAVEGALPVWQAVGDLPEHKLAANDRAALLALSRLLVRAVAELNVEFGLSGEADFIQLAAAARQALTSGGEPTDLALRSGEALRHILVDEFQDTSSEQVELLRLLTASWSAGDGRTLFVVGDPLQSVYQFRDAEVGLFLQAQQQGIGTVALQPLQLRCNFRSAPAIMEWVNERCGRLFPLRDDPRLGAIRYLPALATQDNAGALVKVHASEGDYNAAAEAASVLGIVRAAWATHPNDTIAILVSKRSEAATLTERLQADGIKVQGIKLNPLGDRAVVRDLLALTRALQHLDDRTAWLALLRSPCCGLELSDLQCIAEGSSQTAMQLLQDESRLVLLSEAMRARIARVAQAVQPALDGEERNLALSQRVHRCWLRMGGAALCRDERELADARAFFAALDTYPDDARLVGEACSQLTDKLYAAADAGEPSVAVLTMHAAKGLEWDVVIVPALGCLWPTANAELLNAIELPQPVGAADLLLSPIVAADAMDQLPLTRTIRKLQRRRSQLERERLLYVTATRARRQLHWLGTVKRSQAGDLHPDLRSMLHLLWPAVGPEFEQQLAVAAALSPRITPSAAGVFATTTTPAVPASTTRRRLTATWTATAALLPVQRLPLPMHQPGDEVEYSWVGQTARAVGTVVHAELQRCAQRLVPEISAQFWLAAPRYAEWLAELGVAVAARGGAVLQVLQILQATLRDPRGRWLLTDSEHRAAWSERALTGMHAGRIVNIVIDRMFIDRDGQRWVVDYKTSSHEGGARDRFVADQLERYRPQLQRYAALAAQLGPEPVRCAIYFPVMSEWCEL